MNIEKMMDDALDSITDITDTDDIESAVDNAHDLVSNAFDELTSMIETLRDDANDLLSGIENIEDMINTIDIVISDVKSQAELLKG